MCSLSIFIIRYHAPFVKGIFAEKLRLLLFDISCKVWYTETLRAYLKR